jgi:hypothetical protein
MNRSVAAGKVPPLELDQSFYRFINIIANHPGQGEEEGVSFVPITELADLYALLS